MPKITVRGGASYAEPHPRPGEGVFFQQPVDESAGKAKPLEADQVPEEHAQDAAVDGDHEQVGETSAAPVADDPPAVEEQPPPEVGLEAAPPRIEVKATARGTVTKGRRRG